MYLIEIELYHSTRTIKLRIICIILLRIIKDNLLRIISMYSAHTTGNIGYDNFHPCTLHTRQAISAMIIFIHVPYTQDRQYQLRIIFTHVPCTHYTQHQLRIICIYLPYTHDRQYQLKIICMYSAHTTGNISSR